MRGAHSLNRQRLVLALVFFALVPVAVEVPALIPLGALVAVLAGMIRYETWVYGEGRARVRHDFAVQGAGAAYSTWEQARDDAVRRGRH
jgi:hypothetical protein